MKRDREHFMPRERVERILELVEAELREIGNFNPPVDRIMQMAVHEYPTHHPTIDTAKQIFRRLAPGAITLEEEDGQPPQP